LKLTDRETKNPPHPLPDLGDFAVWTSQTVSLARCHGQSGNKKYLVLLVQNVKAMKDSVLNFLNLLLRALAAQPAMWPAPLCRGIVKPIQPIARNDCHHVALCPNFCHVEFWRQWPIQLDQHLIGKVLNGTLTAKWNDSDQVNTAANQSFSDNDNRPTFYHLWKLVAPKIAEEYFSNFGKML
jgi:hypothetical protein